MSVILATGGYDHKIRFWDATSRSCIRSITFGDSQVNCLSVSNDKSILAAGGNPLLQVFDVQSNEERPLLTYDGHTSNITAVGFQRDLKWIYSSSEDGFIKIWDSRSSNFSRKYDCGSAANAVTISPNQAELASGDQNGYIKIWDLVADKCREEYMPQVDVPIRSISMGSDGSCFIAGSHKGRLFVFTPSSQKSGMEVSVELQAHDDYLLKCLISPDLKIIATTSADKSIKLWSTSTWEVEQRLTKHQRWVWDCTFSADSLYLVSASSDQSAKLWDLQTGEVIRNYTGHNLAVTCVALNDISV